MLVEKGLTSQIAKQKLQEYGPNILPEKSPPSSLSIFFSQLRNPLVYVLLVAAGVTLALREFSDTTIIVIAVVINTTLGFVQEKRASNALYALKKMIHPQAKVIRDGDVATIEASRIVPGDIVVLDSGTKIPADGILIKTNRLFISEAILTGESVPVARNPNEHAYMGTIVLAGQGLLKVTMTAGNTQIGKIATHVQTKDEDTPLKKQLTTFSKELTILVAVLTIFVFVIGRLSGMHLEEIFTTSVALAVSAIPEGLLVALTAVLAIGMQKILKKRGLVRNLVSAETLGGVTTICLDKTGTLTAGNMKVVKVLGDKNALSIQAILANDKDDPIVLAALEWGRKQKPIKLDNLERLDSIPFSSERRLFLSLHKWNEKENMLFVNGAPEILLSHTSLNRNQKKLIEKNIDVLTNDGMRLLGMARVKVPKRITRLNPKDTLKRLEWVGILAMTDPVRPGVREALLESKKAGLNILVITGDYAQTAMYVMNKLGLKVNDKATLLGDDIVKMDTDKLARLLKDKKIHLFARTTPDQKLKIVESLHKNGEVVAMMGDGVNDAPALRSADIGIVVDDATDVAKETADLVLLDSNYQTIVAAIEEGRGIYDNIRKVILYLMSDAFEEIIAVLGAIILRLPLPVGAAQILWINLVSDGFPNLALTVDPKLKGTMAQGPRSPKERVVSTWMRELIVLVSVIGGLSALGVFVYYYLQTNDAILARSIAFAALGVNSLVYVFSIRTLREPFWLENPFQNKWLNLGVIGGFILQFVPFLTPSFREFFDLKPLAFEHVFVIICAAIIMFVTIEIGKHILAEK